MHRRSNPVARRVRANLSGTKDRGSGNPNSGSGLRTFCSRAPPFVPSHKDSDMRVIVLGGGLLGLASAYYLQQLGHEVTVIDRHRTPAAKARGLVETPTPIPHPPAARPRTVWGAAF